MAASEAMGSADGPRGDETEIPLYFGGGSPPGSPPFTSDSAWSDWSGFIDALERVLRYRNQNPLTWPFQEFTRTLLLRARSEEMQNAIRTLVDRAAERQFYRPAGSDLLVQASFDPLDLVFMEFRAFSLAVEKAESGATSEGQLKKALKFLLKSAGTIADSASEAFKDSIIGSAICKGLKELADLFG